MTPMSNRVRVIGVMTIPAMAPSAPEAAKL